MTSGLYTDLADAPHPLPTPRRALAIGAHPDDAEFGAGGTLARWASAGCEVTIAVITDGSKGTWDPNVDPTELIAKRAAEQRAAADVLGATQVVHLGYVDGELESTMKLRADLCRAIRTHQPDVLLSHDPWKRYMLHPDHRAAGWGAIDAMVAARDHLFFPEQRLEAHRPGAMLLWAADEPDHWEDIGFTINQKVRALLCHSSQGETTMGGDIEDAEASEAFSERIRQWARRTGESAGIELAEGFKRLQP